MVLRAYLPDSVDAYLIMAGMTAMDAPGYSGMVGRVSAMSSFICDDKQVWKKTVVINSSRHMASDAWRGAELWDLLDEDGMPVGATHVRGEALPHGAFHRVVEIFTLNSKGEMLVTLRTPEKKLYPNMWETTGGAVVAGEDSLDAARRELREETGIEVGRGEIQLLLTHRSKSAFVDIYVAHKDAEISELTMQPGETVAARWVTFQEFERMMGDGLIPSPVCRRYATVRYILMNQNQ